MSTDAVQVDQQILRANQAFTRRAVKYLAGEGVRQFIVLGSGVPGADSVHAVAQQVDRDCRVVYVDHDPIVVQTALADLDRNDKATIMLGDLRRPMDVLGAEELQLLNFNEPIGLLFVDVLQGVSDLEVGIAVSAWRAATAPGGGYVAISHAASDLEGPRFIAESASEGTDGAEPIVPRSRMEVAALFDGYDIVPPGLVELQEWSAEVADAAHTPRVAAWAAVGKLNKA